MLTSKFPPISADPVLRPGRPPVALLYLFFLSLNASAQTNLTIDDIAISDVEGGAKASDRRGFSAGEHVFLDFKIGGYKISDEPRRANLEWQVTAADDKGTPLSAAASETVDVEITPEDKHWRPRVRYSTEVPAVPRAAEHRFLITVKDKLAGTELRKEIAFRVDSSFPEPPSHLAIHDLHFYRGEGDEMPVEGGQDFHPGDKLFVRFYLTGYKFSEKNLHRLEYGLSLADSLGKTMLSVPKAAEESRESFYPKTYTLCAIGITLEKTIKPGVYVLLVSARDLVGDQQIESEYRFRVH